MSSRLKTVALIACTLFASDVFAQAGNNNLANARTSTIPFTDTGTTTAATSETGELVAPCTDKDGPNSVWWRFTPTTAGLVTINLAGSTFDTVLSLWTGTAHPLSLVACNDDTDFDGGVYTSSVQNFQVAAGTTYYIRVTGYDGEAGNVNLAVTFTTASGGNNALSGALPISALPFTGTGSNVGATRETGEATTSAACSAGGDGNNSVWWRFRPTATGPVTIDLTGSNFDTILSLWSGATPTHPVTAVGCNDDIDTAGGVTASRLQNVSVTAGTTYYIRVSGFAGASGNVSLSVTGAIALSTGRDDVPAGLTLATEGPNPFGTEAAFRFTVPTDGPAHLAAFDALGRRVAVLFDGLAAANQPHQAALDASALPSGVYMLRLTHGGYVLTTKVTKR